MSRAYKVLVFGASYGSLFATKVAAAGHDATLVCQRATAELINREGTRVLFPVKGAAPVEVASPDAARRGARRHAVGRRSRRV